MIPINEEIWQAQGSSGPWEIQVAPHAVLHRRTLLNFIIFEETETLKEFGHLTG